MTEYLADSILQMDLDEDSDDSYFVISKKITHLIMKLYGLFYVEGAEPALMTNNLSGTIACHSTVNDFDFTITISRFNQLYRFFFEDNINDSLGFCLRFSRELIRDFKSHHQINVCRRENFFRRSHDKINSFVHRQQHLVDNTAEIVVNTPERIPRYPDWVLALRDLNLNDGANNGSSSGNG